MFRKVTDAFWVSPQIQAGDLDAAAAQGVAVVVNNRPDLEEPGQPLGEAIRAQAEALGLVYIAIHVRGAPGSDEIEAFRSALDDGRGPVLAYCKSGTRSILIWAAAEITAGRLTPTQAAALALNAGYDISRWV